MIRGTVRFGTAAGLPRHRERSGNPIHSMVENLAGDWTLRRRLDWGSRRTSAASWIAETMLGSVTVYQGLDPAPATSPVRRVCALACELAVAKHVVVERAPRLECLQGL